MYYNINFARSYYPRVVVYNFSEETPVEVVPEKSLGKKILDRMEYFVPAMRGAAMYAEAFKRAYKHRGDPNRHPVRAAWRLGGRRGYNSALGTAAVVAPAATYLTVKHPVPALAFKAVTSIPQIPSIYKTVRGFFKSGGSGENPVAPDNSGSVDQG